VRSRDGELIRGKVVLVTGANSGVGEAVAVAFEKAGATVFRMGRRQEAFKQQVPLGRMGTIEEVARWGRWRHEPHVSTTRIQASE
jgi:NAD(P)-dependent dehydrogenase (short-subunit alcohol dehydrogenase family)